MWIPGVVWEQGKPLAPVLPTLNTDVRSCNSPLVPTAYTLNRCDPAVALICTLTIVFPAYQPTFRPSSQTSMPAVVPLFRPAALIVKGEVTIDPLAGEQITTPGVDGCVHELVVCICSAAIVSCTGKEEVVIF